MKTPRTPSSARTPPRPCADAPVPKIAAGAAGPGRRRASTGRAKAAHMRQARTDRIESRILDAIGSIKARLAKAPKREWPKRLLLHFEAESARTDAAGPPDIEVIRRVRDRVWAHFPTGKPTGDWQISEAVQRERDRAKTGST